ncbi:MAG: cytochrome c maturation protein CcmE [Devosia sp.]|uniref:cytochrome c maturation protein CcmE n=1 Tax=Devosia sp. TaxID=1871048 RepID=UPI00339756B7
MTMPSAVRRKGWSRKQKRLAVIAGLGVVLVIAAALVLTALRDQIVFFYSPTDVQTRGVEPGHPIRLGGLVKDGSWVREGQSNRFVVTDGATEIAAHYVGILPDLFREGQGVVAEGAIGPDGSFTATNVLAKHDENYLPREVVDALKAQGEWRPETATP